jgi:hypothetical protein
MSRKELALGHDPSKERKHMTTPRNDISDSKVTDEREDQGTESNGDGNGDGERQNDGSKEEKEAEESSGQRA